MNKRNYFTKTFGLNWGKKIFLLSIVIIFIALLPSLLFYNEIKFVKHKFVEEWFKNILSLTILFIFINYFNYSINYQRNRDKISMLLEKLIFFLEETKEQIEKQNNYGIKDKLKIVEKFIKKIQDEEEFLYSFEEFEEYKNYGDNFLRFYSLNFDLPLSESEKQNLITFITLTHNTFNNLYGRIHN